MTVRSDPGLTSSLMEATMAEGERRSRIDRLLDLIDRILRILGQ